MVEVPYQIDHIIINIVVFSFRAHQTKAGLYGVPNCENGRLSLNPGRRNTARGGRSKWAGMEWLCKCILRTPLDNSTLETHQKLSYRAVASWQARFPLVTMGSHGPRSTGAQHRQRSPDLGGALGQGVKFIQWMTAEKKRLVESITAGEEQQVQCKAQQHDSINQSSDYSVLRSAWRFKNITVQARVLLAANRPPSSWRHMRDGTARASTTVHPNNEAKFPGEPRD
jgi:hypothetical protein